jgi:flavin-dependent dehydrogenase
VPLPAGVAVSREAFDAALAEEAIKRGADFLPATRASLLEDDDPNERHIRLTQPDAARNVRARVVLAADGLGGGLLARAGMGHAEVRAGSRIGAGAVFVCPGRDYEPGVIHMASGSGGYVGLVRLEDRRLDVAAALDASAVREAGGLAQLAGAILHEAGWPVPVGLPSACWRGTPALTRKLRQVAGRRIFVLGDAAGYVEPFTGEGMAWAASSAVAVVPIALAAVRDWGPRSAAAWQRRHGLLARRRITCRLLAALLRRPWLTRAVAASLGLLPALASPVVTLLNRNLLAPQDVR